MLATFVGSAATLARASLPDSIYVAVKPGLEQLFGLQELELAYLRRALQGPRRRLVDAGANWGSYSVLLGRDFRYVEAFEPIARLAEALRAYATLRRRPIAVHACALSDRNGRAYFSIERQNGDDLTATAHLVDSEPDATLTVEARTLDSFDFADVDLIKIDVEGHEMQVIRGARETIRRCRPKLLVEVERRHASEPFWDRIRSIERLGYRGFFLRDGRMVPIAGIDLDVDQNVANIATRRSAYINNFFFEAV